MPQISFFRPSYPPPFLPSGVTRTHIPTPSGPLELLIAKPLSPHLNKKMPILFAHGGCGSAAVWIPYMQFFSQRHGIPCYALSYRGHGTSWDPGYLRMYFSWMSTLAGDLVRGLEWVGRETGEVVLVGHSSGGGLSQYVLSKGLLGEGMVRVRGLCLAGAIPGFGSLGVNLNWLTFDPFFLPRMLLHLGHPMSPLSSTSLVHRAFFSPNFPLSAVAAFEKLMPVYESFLWPQGMMFPFVNFQNVLLRICGWGRGERVLVLAGESDRLVSLDIARREAEEYRAAHEALIRAKKIEADVGSVVEEGMESSGCGVVLRVVEGAGHHFQNDSMWEKGAEKLLQWYEQL